MTKTNHHTRGRGSNPASRKNLTGPERIFYVYERGSGIGWSKLTGAMTFRQAYEYAAKLESTNNTDCKPMYVATSDF